MTVETLVLGPVSANTYIVTDDVSGETAVIDCGECTAELLEKLSNKNVKYILLTHGHADHILGVYGLRQAFPEAKIVIHREDAICLTDERYSLGVSIAPGRQKNTEADITVDEGDKIALGSLVFTVMHTPGHTKGSVCYYVESERALFTGDTLFCLTVGRTDLYGGNDDEMYASIKRLYEMPGDYAIFTGHNRSTTMEYERRRNRYMRRFK